MIKKIKKFFWSLRIGLLSRLRTLNANARMTPDFLVIGAQKGGTSSLFYYFKFHPSINRPIKKEMHYFNLNFHKGRKWYLAHFPLQSENKITGEASPDYIFHPEAPARIKSLNPNIKLIVLLRNPIERAYSAYQMNRRLGIDPHNSFESAIDFELNHQDKNTTDYTHAKHNFFYLERGKYAEQLSHWAAHFSKDQLLVIRSEDFFRQTEKELFNVYNFLNIEKISPPSFSAMNTGSYLPVNEETRNKLAKFFKDDLDQLNREWNINLSV